jgi:phage terminase large subunit
VLESRHEDNPSLFDGQGNILEAGQGRMAVLDRLTGVRKERLRFGRWVNAEGAVYEFDEAVHLIDPFAIPLNWRRLRVVDFGYINPFVCQWWAVDHDGRMYLYREIYMTRRTVQAHVPKILELSGGAAIETTVADHDAEDRATLEGYGIMTEVAVKSISAGIQKVEERLKRAGDGKPRLFVFRDACVEMDGTLAEMRKPTCTAEEFAVYMWPKGSDGKPLKEVPLDLDNHGMDAMRYAVMYVDGDRRDGQAGFGHNPLEGYRG